MYLCVLTLTVCAFLAGVLGDQVQAVQVREEETQRAQQQRPWSCAEPG